MVGGTVAYLAVGLLAWWHVVAGGMTHTITSSGWGDPAQQIWFLAWVPHALGAGIDPFVSHAIFAPAGINLMANSSILFPALVASPITAAFGPIVAFNVLVVVAPALSALAAWRVYRRYSSSELGSFLGGLFYGFSPFVLNDLADGHLHITTLVFPPLVLALLDDLVVREKGSPVKVGVLLGLVLTAQALTSLEVLAMTVLIGGVGVVALAVRHPSEVRARWRRTATGLAATAVTAGLLLAWPVAVLVAGPRRYTGSVFVSPESYVVWLEALVWPKAGATHLWAAYLGIPLVVLFVVGVVVVRNGALRLAGVLAVAALVFSMGRTAHLTPKVSTGLPLPDRLFTTAPFLESLLPVRFDLFIDLFAGLALAVVAGAFASFVSARPRLGRPAGVAAAGLLGVAALALPAVGARLPYPTRQIAVPAVYSSATLTHLPAGSVLLAYPVMNGFEADPMIWQAVEGFPYDMVAGYGFIPSHGPHPLGSLPASPVTDLFADAQLGLLPAALPAAQARAVRAELARWQVSDLVVLPEGKQPARLVQLLARLLHRRPVALDGAELFLHLRPPALG